MGHHHSKNVATILTDAVNNVIIQNAENNSIAISSVQNVHFCGSVGGNLNIGQSSTQKQLNVSGFLKSFDSTSFKNDLTNSMKQLAQKYNSTLSGLMSSSSTSNEDNLVNKLINTVSDQTVINCIVNTIQTQNIDVQCGTTVGNNVVISQNDLVDGVFAHCVSVNQSINDMVNTIQNNVDQIDSSKDSGIFDVLKKIGPYILIGVIVIVIIILIYSLVHKKQTGRYPEMPMPMRPPMPQPMYPPRPPMMRPPMQQSYQPQYAYPSAAYQPQPPRSSQPPQQSSFSSMLQQQVQPYVQQGIQSAVQSGMKSLGNLVKSGAEFVETNPEVLAV